MAISLKNCNVLKEQNKVYVRNSFKVMHTFDYCLTERAKNALNAYIKFRLYTGSAKSLTPEDLKARITELLKGCCGISRVNLITSRAVEKAEGEIERQVKYAIVHKCTTCLYDEKANEDTMMDYVERSTDMDTFIDEFLKGVKQI